MKLFNPYTYDAADLDLRITDITSPEISETNYNEILLRILSFLDLTTLEGTDNDSRIIQLCRKARVSSWSPGLPDVAAVCVYPNFVRLARRELSGTGIKVACVAAAFPAGQTSIRVKLEEIRYAVDEGAQEVDVVINRGRMLSGQYDEVFDEISAMREAAGKVHMKVILETGELESVGMIRKASEIAILAGADFIKTSTGKISPGATLTAMLVMLDTINEYLGKTGRAVGIKPAGGIREPRQAVDYYLLVEAVLGEQWLDKDHFRIGASSLADKIIADLQQS